jgi:hypothetical protein
MQVLRPSQTAAPPRLVGAAPRAETGRVPSRTQQRRSRRLWREATSLMRAVMEPAARRTAVPTIERPEAVCQINVAAVVTA